MILSFYLSLLEKLSVVWDFSVFLLRKYRFQMLAVGSVVKKNNATVWSILSHLIITCDYHICYVDVMTERSETFYVTTIFEYLFFDLSFEIRQTYIRGNKFFSF